MERVTIKRDINEDMAIVAIRGEDTLMRVIINITVLVSMYVVIM